MGMFGYRLRGVIVGFGDGVCEDGWCFTAV